MTSSDEMLKESISALMDNQASELELRRILKQLPEDPELAATWRRYQLASHLLHRSETALLKVDLSSAISSAIEAEGAHSVVIQKTAAPWLRWATKSAVAASVALAVLIGVQQFGADPAAPMAASTNAVPAGEVNSSAQQIAEASQDVNSVSVVQTVPDGFSLPSPMARSVSSQADRLQTIPVQPVSLEQTDWRNDPEVQAQLNQMLLDHANSSATHGSFGLLPYTRISSAPLEESSAVKPVESVSGKR